MHQFFVSINPEDLFICTCSAHIDTIATFFIRFSADSGGNRGSMNLCTLNQTGPNLSSPQKDKLKR